MIVRPIRVAIIGGGLGGTLLANALTQYPQLDVNLYEANSEFKERGASVGLARHAKRALRLLGMENILSKAKAVKVLGCRIVVGEGPDAQQTALDADPDLDTVHRAALLKELLAPISKDKLHLGKRLVSISDDTVHFDDGTSVTTDLVIGSDGIHSSVRKFVFGEGHPAVEPVFAGFWDCRAVMPFEVAQAKLGPNRISKETPRQHLYVGKNCMAFHDTIDGGETICVVAAGPTPPEWNKTEWKRSVSREWLDELFADWGTFGTDFLDLFGEQKELPTFMEWESSEAPQLHNGKNLCLIGDAAHATTPWQGSGLALAIEDSMILSSVLGRCSHVQDIALALNAYDMVMRPRGRSIIESSRVTGLICCGQNGVSAKQLGTDLEHRWDFIFAWDAEKARDDAINSFENTRSSSRNS